MMQKTITKAQSAGTSKGPVINTLNTPGTKPLIYLLLFLCPQLVNPRLHTLRDTRPIKNIRHALLCANGLTPLAVIWQIS